VLVGLAARCVAFDRTLLLPSQGSTLWREPHRRLPIRPARQSATRIDAAESVCRCPRTADVAGVGRPVGRIDGQAPLKQMAKKSSLALDLLPPLTATWGAD